MKRQLQKIVARFAQQEGYDAFCTVQNIFAENGCEIQVMEMEKSVTQKQMQEEHVLWITDDVTTADTLYLMRQPVLFYLSAGNNADLSCVTYCIEGFEDVDFAYFDQIYCRCMHLPWTVFETERLLVREQTVADVDRLYELYAEPSVTEYMEGLFTKREQEYEYTKEYIKNVYGFYGYGIWIVIEKESGKMIGRAGLENKEGAEGLEIGFMIGVPYQGKGYATEVCRAILQYGREELEVHNYRALVCKDNVVSIKVLTKLGFHYVGETIENQLPYDVYTLYTR